jgi:hypothetical protein
MVAKIYLVCDRVRWVIPMVRDWDKITSGR